jgi:hypothetical protein
LSSLTSPAETIRFSFRARASFACSSGVFPSLNTTCIRASG